MEIFDLYEDITESGISKKEMQLTDVIHYFDTIKSIENGDYDDKLEEENYYSRDEGIDYPI